MRRILKNKSCYFPELEQPWFTVTIWFAKRVLLAKYYRRNLIVPINIFGGSNWESWKLSGTIEIVKQTFLTYYIIMQKWHK